MIKFLIKWVSILTLSFLVGLSGPIIYNKAVEYYKYRFSLEYKEALTFQIYKNLRLYTGQPVVSLIIVEDLKTQNAWTDNKYIYITTGWLKVLNEDEIAGILAHEMAHNMLKHAGWPKILYPSALSQIDKEAHADKMGVYLLLSAGYNVCNARNVWNTERNIGDGDYADPWNQEHPSQSYRYYNMTMPWCWGR
jgi:predicted Zn-dependent protease